LHVLPLAVPSLAERADDIPALVEYFCADACKRHGLPQVRVAGRALRACRDAAWPGNLRELANTVEAAVVRARLTNASVLTDAHLFPGTRSSDDALPTLQEATRAFRRRFVQDALERFDWNVAETARHLDLTRGHLYSLITDLDLRRDR
jgi:two-component system response regulator GlrR